MAQSEYEALRHLDGGSRSRHPFLLPRAYNFAATTCALSMERLQGQSLDKRMRLAQGRRAFDECLRVSAGWLQGLHGVPPVYGKTGNDHATMLQRLELDCGPLAGRNPMAEQALAFMRRSLEEINGLAINHVLLHGDFKASNLIWTQGGVFGIDIELRFRNPGAMDVAQFITDILLNRHRIPAIARDQNVTPILDVFLEAYGDNSEQNRKVTAWWLLYFLLSHWEEDLKGRKPSMFVNRNYGTVLGHVMPFCYTNSFAGAVAIPMKSIS